MRPGRRSGSARPAPGHRPRPKYTRRRQRLASASATRVDLENLVEARIAEDVLEVAVDRRQAQATAGPQQPLVRFQENAEAGAGEVLEVAAVERDDALEAIEVRLRRGSLGRVEPSREHDGRLAASFDRQHRSSPLRFAAPGDGAALVLRKTMRPHRSPSEYAYCTESTRRGIRYRPRPPGCRWTAGSAMSTGGAWVTSKRSASGSVNVTCTPCGIAAISIATGALPRLYFTMLVNSS